MSQLIQCLLDELEPKELLRLYLWSHKRHTILLGLAQSKLGFKPSNLIDIHIEMTNLRLDVLGYSNSIITYNNKHLSNNVIELTLTTLHSTLVVNVEERIQKRGMKQYTVIIRKVTTKCLDDYAAIIDTLLNSCMQFIAFPTTVTKCDSTTVIVNTKYLSNLHISGTNTIIAYHSYYNKENIKHGGEIALLPALNSVYQIE
jgi:hypothetical protein